MPRNSDYRELINERFEGITKLFHTHFENVNEKLDEVIKHQKDANARTGKLEEWKIEFEGGRKAKKAILTTIWTIVVIASSLIAIMSFVRGTNNVKELQVIENKLDDKQDKEIDSTVRAGNFGFLPITEDTAYQRKLLESTEKILGRKIRED